MTYKVQYQKCMHANGEHPMCALQKISNHESYVAFPEVYPSSLILFLIFFLEEHHDATAHFESSTFNFCQSMLFYCTFDIAILAVILQISPSSYNHWIIKELFTRLSIPQNVKPCM